MSKKDKNLMFSAVLNAEVDRIEKSSPDYISGKKRTATVNTELVVDALLGRYNDAAERANKTLEDPKASIPAKINALAALARSAKAMIRDEYLAGGVMPSKQQVDDDYATLKAEAEALHNKQQPQQP